MKVTVFTESPAKLYGRMVTYEPTWYIRTKNHRILFVAGKSDSFWKYAGQMGIDVRAIDTILLPQGCEDPIREDRYDSSSAGMRGSDPGTGTLSCT